MSHPSPYPAILSAFPAGLPFTVNLRLFPYLLRHQRALLIMTVPFSALMIIIGIYLLDSGPSTIHVRKYGIGEVPAAAVAWAAIALGVVLMASPFVTALRQLATGPAFGADKTGIYVRPSLDAKRTQFLPWEQVRLLAVRNMNGPNLCVPPADPSVEIPFTVANSYAKGHFSGRSAGQAMAQHRRMKNLGTNIFVPIGGADRSPAEIIEVLRQWSSGRVPTGA